MESLIVEKLVVSRDISSWQAEIFPENNGIKVKEKLGQRLGVPFVRTLQETIPIKLGTDKEVKIYQDGNGVLGISGVVWDAAMYLIDFLITIVEDHNVALEDVLDVGTGTGVCGISALLLGAKKVTLTDSYFNASAESNIDELPENLKNSVAFIPHNWNDDVIPSSIKSPSTDKHQWDLLLCSDLVYDEKHHQSLLKFLNAISFRCAVFSYKKRSEDVEKLFFEHLSNTFDIYLINPSTVVIRNIVSLDSIESGLFLLFLVPKS